jgi:hypothetical protein
MLQEISLPVLALCGCWGPRHPASDGWVISVVEAALEVVETSITATSETPITVTSKRTVKRTPTFLCKKMRIFDLSVKAHRDLNHMVCCLCGSSHIRYAVGNDVFSRACSHWTLDFIKTV